MSTESKTDERCQKVKSLPWLQKWHQPNMTASPLHIPKWVSLQYLPLPHFLIRSPLGIRLRWSEDSTGDSLW